MVDPVPQGLGSCRGSKEAARLPRNSKENTNLPLSDCKAHRRYSWLTAHVTTRPFWLRPYTFPFPDMCCLCKPLVH